MAASLSSSAFLVSLAVFRCSASSAVALAATSAASLAYATPCSNPSAFAFSAFASSLSLSSFFSRAFA
eukprot:5359475-Heterocapsa_arctica.AAC.1